jgi:hypothetical protein
MIGLAGFLDSVPESGRTRLTDRVGRPALDDLPFRGQGFRIHIDGVYGWRFESSVRQVEQYLIIPSRLTGDELDVTLPRCS